MVRIDLVISSREVYGKQMFKAALKEEQEISKSSIEYIAPV